MATYEVDVGGKTYEVDAPDPNIAWQWANQHHTERKQAFDAKVAADQAETRKRFAEEEKSRPLGERVLANVGAGFHRLGQALSFADKADVEEHNKLREQLAATMPGGKAVQVGAEILPTMLVPGGAGGQALSKLPKVGQAIARAAATRTGNVANVAATGGALGALTTPGDLGDRAIAGGLSAGFGAALPASMAMVQGARRMATQRGGQLATGERFLRELEQEGPGRVDELLTGLTQHGPTRHTFAGVQRPTAAQLTGDPVLRELEVGARTRQGAAFAAGDELANQGRADVLNRIAGTAEDLAQAEASRAATTGPMRETALNAARQTSGFANPVLQAAQQIAAGEARPNPAVQTMTRYVIGQLEQGVSPEQLYTIRKTLTTGVPHGTELGAAITQSRAERMKLVEAIDDALDAASGGKWRQYMDRYQELSQPVTSMRAGQAIQRDFGSSAQTTRQGDPVLTASKLRRAIQARGEKQFGGRTISRITPAERAQLEAVADSAEAETAARMSQGLVGSRTAGNIAAGENVNALSKGIGSLIGGVPGAAVSTFLPKWSRARDERILAQVLQEPELLAQLIEQARRTRALERGVGETARATRAAGDLME